MISVRKPFPVYNSGHELDISDRTAQIRHLALIGIAARSGGDTIRDMGAAYVSLFEVIARLADEVDGEIDHLNAIRKGGTA